MDKIICCGKNYQDHILELGDKPVTKPVLFLKPPSVLKQCTKWGSTVQAYAIDAETHYECELVIKLNKGGYKMTDDEAKDAIASYSIGLDMTLRKEQALLKANGQPWTMSKVFPDSCIVGPWVDIVDDVSFLETQFKFTLDNELKQNSYGKNMLFDPVELIVYVSQFFPLCAGDIMFTGTPSGVGPIGKNSVAILELGELNYTVKWSPM